MRERQPRRHLSLNLEEPPMRGASAAFVATMDMGHPRSKKGALIVPPQTARYGEGLVP